MISRREIVVSIFILFFCNVSGEIVGTENGEVNGTVMQSWTGQNFHAFFAIPYAQPPIDELRFQPPRPAKSWNGTLLATVYGPICWQPSQGENFPEMDENCLTLNVFTKNIPSNNETELKPVIVFIHGGNFQTGSASLEAGPRYLMDRDIVYVSINYRLGALGFLAIDSEESPGNMGMKDQVMALKWIKANVKNFGGNPDKITISGMSVGAWSVTSLMVSPMSQNLFHGVIAHSGAITTPLGLRKNNLDWAIAIAQQVGCSSVIPGEIVSCLRTIQAENIVNANLINVPYCTSIFWRPVVEPDFGQDRFLVEDPNETFRKGNFPKIPVIAGITTNEFVSSTIGALVESNLKQLNENFDDIAPNCFEYSLAENPKAVGNVLRKAYLPLDTIDVRSFNNLNNLFSDAMIGVSVHRFVHLISNMTNVYYYHFSFIGRYSLFYYPRNRPYGVHHADDMQYIMSEYISPLYGKSDQESFIVERMTRIYEQFAWTGNPNNASDEFLSEMNWSELDLANELYMDIGQHFIEKNGLNLERYLVWDRLETASASKLKFTTIMFILLIKLLI